MQHNIRARGKTALHALLGKVTEKQTSSEKE